MKIKYHGLLNGSHSWAVVGRALIKTLRSKGYNVCCTNTSKTDGDKRDPEIAALEVPASEPADIIISYTIPPNLAKLRPLCKTLVHIYNYETSIMPAGWAQLMNQYADIILPSSRYALQIFAQNGVSRQKMEIIPHGYDPVIFNPSIEPFNFGIPKFKFLAIAIPHARKGLDLLLKAYGQEFGSTEPVSLILKTQITQGQTSAEINVHNLLKEVRETVALPEVKIIQNFVENMAPYYRGASCFVSASRAECFGLPQLEAAACNIPIITPRHGGPLDFLNDNSARLVDTGQMQATVQMQYWAYNKDALIGAPSVMSLRKQMRDAFIQRQKNAFLANNAIERVKDLTWDKVVDKLVLALEQKNSMSLVKMPQLDSKIKESTRPSQKIPIVSIIIPAYNGFNYTKFCIDSIIKQTTVDYEIILVDNGSTDQTKDIQSLYPQVRVVQNNTNLGFARACNQGIQNARGRFIILLNNDIIIHDSQWVQKLTRGLSVSDLVAHQAGRLKEDYTFLEHINDPSQSFDYLVGYCLAFKKVTTKKLGLLSEDYGLGYYEDTDYSFRAKKLGLKLSIVPDINLVHYGSKTTSTLDKNQLYRNALNVFRTKWKKSIKESIGLEPTFDFAKITNSKNAPLVSIITPTFNGLALLKDCIESFVSHNCYPKWEWIIVDNASTDGTQEYLGTLGSDSHFKIKRNETNSGSFSFINNDSIKDASGEYVLFLNNDTQSTKDWLSSMVGLLYVGEDIGAVGAVLRYPNGQIQHAGIELHQSGLYPFNLKKITSSIPYQTMAVSAACMLVRKKDFIDLGYFDEQYNYCFEDVDFCFKMKAFGNKKNIVQPAAELIHKESQTLEQLFKEQDRLAQNGPIIQNKWWKTKRIEDLKISNSVYRIPLSDKINDICGTTIVVTEQPLVSVVIPTYQNFEALTKRSLASVLNQTYKNLEIIVISDAPGKEFEDKITAHIEQLDDKRVKYIKNQVRPNYPLDPIAFKCTAGAVPRNMSLELLQGKYIAPLDDDDEWARNYVEECVDILEKQPVDVVYVGAKYQTHPELSEIDRSQWMDWAFPFNGDNLLNKGNFIFHSSVMYSAKYKNYKYSMEGKQPADWEHWKDLYRAGANFYFLNKPLLFHFCEKWPAKG